MKKLLFTELELSPEILKAVQDMGFEEATPIQSLAIPAIRKGKDVIGQAQTGTGKTAAFGIPILEMIDPKIKKPQAVILCPTRELAIQVAEEIISLAKHKRGVAVLPVYGGQPIERQIHALRKGVHIIIGTPGRMIDHLERRTLALDTVRMVVLDEADEMLDMGFRDDIEIILKNIPRERQTVFFSATMPRAFIELTKKYQKNPHSIAIAHTKLTVPDIKQISFEVRETSKLEILVRVIDLYGLHLSLVFCNTKKKVDEVVALLQARGYSSDAIHGDMNQPQRDRVMGKFRNGTIEILVATDVAARGIDVENIEAVFNYDIPHDEESYVHRIGRTGRAGKSGYAFTFVAGKEAYKLRDIQRYAKVDIQRKPIPTIKDVEEVRITQHFEKVRTILEKEDTEQYATMIEHQFGDNYAMLEIAGALLKMSLAPAAKPEAAPAHKGAHGQQGIVKLFLSVGKKDNVRPGDILGAIAGETGIQGSLIGEISVHHAFSFVEVPAENASQIISIMSKRQIKNKPLTIQPAK
ncbi:MAG: ATP-dependent RNA helicase [Elusimicrobia bacterium RIFOXYA2_FULL_50_26]|nr:MAG: ATP-dependent RNA helicase [Elusimicrobia bacterium RIFOXYA2_FULL_50_26]